MVFALLKNDPSVGGDGLRELGVVIAPSIEKAAAKIGLGIKEICENNRTGLPWAMLVRGCHLVQKTELNSPADIPPEE